MKRMRTAMALALGCLLALAACKGGEPAKPGADKAAAPAAAADKPAAASEPAKPAGETVEVVLWHSYREGEKVALEQTVAKFNESGQGIKVRLLNVPYDAFVDKVTIATPRGQGPDLFIFAHNMIGEWVDRTRILEPLGDRIAPDVLKRFIPNTVKALVYKQSLYGLPLAFKSLALFYLPEVVKTPPADSQQLMDVAKAATDKAAGRYGLVYEAGLLYFEAAFIHGFGGTILDEGGKPHVDEKPVADALAYVKSLVKAGVLPSGVNSAMVTSLFNEGKAAMAISGPWFLSEVAKDRVYEVAPLPTMPGGVRAKPYLGSEAMFLSSYSKNKEAALKVMQYLTSDEAADIRLKVGRQTVANAVLYDREDVKADKVISVFRQAAEDTVLMPSRPELQVVWSTMDMAINKSVFGEAEPAAALKEAQAKIESDVSKMAK